MATLRRNKRKLVSVLWETQEYSRSSQSQNTSAPVITEGFITQVSEEIEGRLTEKLSQEFSRTESRFLGGLPKLDIFPLNPQIQTLSGTVPKTFRNADVENQEPRRDLSQNDPHPEVEISACCASNVTDSDPQQTSHRFFISDFYNCKIVLNVNFWRLRRMSVTQ